MISRLRKFGSDSGMTTWKEEAAPTQDLIMDGWAAESVLLTSAFWSSLGNDDSRLFGTGIVNISPWSAHWGFRFVVPTSCPLIDAFVQRHAVMAQTATSEDCGPMIARVSIAVYAIAVLFVALRFVTRGWLVKKFGLDDLLIGVAVLVGAGETIALQLQVHHGRKLQCGTAEDDETSKILMYKYINMLLYYVANGAVKLSILVLYYRICSLQKVLPWFLRGAVVWSMWAAITAFTLSTLFVEMFSCLPVTAIFDLRNPTRKCTAWVPFYLSQAGIDVFINLVLLLFPLPLLAILRIDRKQRYLLVLVFSIGLLPLVASIIRLYQIVTAADTKAAMRPAGDSRWEGPWIPLWSQIEVDVGIVAASLPCLSPLLKQIWSGFAHSRTLSPSYVPACFEPGFNIRGGEAQGLQKLPSTISMLPSNSISTFGTLPNKSVSTLGSLPNRSVSTLCELGNTKRLTFFDDSEDGGVDREAFPDPNSTAQIGVARTVNTRLSRATFVDVPVSPRRSLGFTGLSILEATA
ncbi:hypothetical protein PMIN07_002732 [Paraphaeosphaeria minitans]